MCFMRLCVLRSDALRDGRAEAAAPVRGSEQLSRIEVVALGCGKLINACRQPTGQSQTRHLRSMR